MAFDVAADAYDRFMGRYSSRLAPAFADFAGVRGDALDVGCGPGALTRELVQRAESVAAVDPSPPFVEAVRVRFPAVEALVAPAEALPFADDSFDAVLAQLVVHFMADPVAGVREMARVARDGGVVAACVWEHRRMPLSPFWEAVEQLGGEDDEAGRAGTREGHLAEIFDDAGLEVTADTSLEVHVSHDTFEEWWEPFTLGAGPPGVHYQSLDGTGRERLRAACLELLGPGPVSIPARVWAVRAGV